MRERGREFFLLHTHTPLNWLFLFVSTGTPNTNTIHFRSLHIHLTVHFEHFFLFFVFVDPNSSIEMIMKSICWFQHIPLTCNTRDSEECVCMFTSFSRQSMLLLAITNLTAFQSRCYRVRLLLLSFVLQKRKSFFNIFAEFCCCCCCYCCWFFCFFNDLCKIERNWWSENNRYENSRIRKNNRQIQSNVKENPTQ